MTNSIAIALFIIILALLGVDFLFYDWRFTVLWMEKFLHLVWWVTFWR